MVNAGPFSFTSFTEAGYTLPPPVDLHLLPLLKSEKVIEPPLERLQSGSLIPDRVVFKTDKATWTSSNHVFPAAFPRSHFHATHLPGPEPFGVRKELVELELSEANDEKSIKRRKEVEKQIRQKDIEEFTEQLTSLCTPETVYPPHSREEAERIANTLKDSGQPQLWSCIQRIVPSRTDENSLKGKKPIILFMTHANGFHKEIYEPMLESLLNELESQKSEIYIEEIWNMDTFNSGDAGVLNRDHLGICSPWWDHARDMKQFLQSYLPPLSRKGKEEGKPGIRLKEQTSGAGRKGRTIICISHSHSGACSQMLFMTHPNLCDGHVTIDPMQLRFEDFSVQALPQDQVLGKGASVRKDIFKNRQTLEKYMESKPYFTAWDKRVREIHSRFGFYPVPGYEQKGDPPVTLCMTKWSEASIFAHTWAGAWGALETTRPHKDFKGFCHVFWTDYTKLLFPLESSADQVRENFEKFGNRFTTSRLNTNHLAAQEKPDLSAKEIAKVILTQIKTIHIPTNSAKL